MRFLVLFFLCIVVITTSCDKNNLNYGEFNEQRNIKNYLFTQNLDITPSASGLYIQRIEQGTGANPVDSSFFVMDYFSRRLDGGRPEGTPYSTNRIDWARFYNIKSTYAYGNKAVFKVGQSYFDPALTEALLQMQEGDSVRLIMPSTLSGTGNNMPIVLFVKLHEVIPDIIKWERDKINAYLDTVSGIVKPVEVTIPKTDNEKDMIYVISYGGARNDSLPKQGNSVKLDYMGRFIDGTPFELRRMATLNVKKSSEESTSGIIDGLMEGLLNIHPGETATVIIPYRLAYGDTNQYEIGTSYSYNSVVSVPAYSSLIFDVQIHSITSE